MQILSYFIIVVFIDQFIIVAFLINAVLINLLNYLSIIIVVLQIFKPKLKNLKILIIHFLKDYKIMIIVIVCN